MHAFSKEQLLKCGPLDVSPEMQPDGELSSKKGKTILSKLLEEGSSHFEWLCRNFDGEDLFVEISLTRIPFHDEKPFIYVVCRDITERKRAEEKIEHLSCFPQLNPNPILETDMEGNITFYNQATVETLHGLRMREDPVLFLPDNMRDILSDFRSGKKTQSCSEIVINGAHLDVAIYYVKRFETAHIYVNNITERKKTEDSLKRREEELQVESNRLEEANTALKVLLKHREDDKKEMEEKFLSNIKELVLPYVGKLKKSRLDSNQMAYMEIIEANMNDVISPFLQRMSLKYSNFTQTEILVANLIKIGKTTKEIAESMNVSKGTTDTHRNNIRSKLGLNRKKVNLRAYLLSIA